jgi:hypothetical protein
MIYDYAGCIHFHSDHSFDGFIPVSDIIKAARKNSLDFIMLTDHSSLGAKPMEGWYGNTLLIVGQEISPRFNHYIAFGTSRPVFVEEDAGLLPQSYIDEVHRQGGIGFISHPDHRGASMFHVKHYPWLDWSVSGFTGMGIWDFMTDWQSSLTGWIRAIMCLLFPALMLKGPEEKTLRRWDLLTRTRRVVGIGETDNHAVPRSFVKVHFRIFPFERIFRYIRTHVMSDTMLSGNVQDDTATILRLLEQGRAYIAMDYFKKAEGFSFMIDDGETYALMGDDFILKNEAVVHVKAAGRGKIRIIKDGKLWNEVEGDVYRCPVREKGVYRIEVFLSRFGRLRPWIFSNPIYVK